MNPKSILICGQAGQGIQSIGYILAKSFVRAGYYVFAWQDFQSRIRGGESSFRIVVDEKPVKSLTEKYDLIVSLDKENTKVYRALLKKDGLLVASPDTDDGNVYQIDFSKIALKVVGKSLYTNAAATGAIAALMDFPSEIIRQVIMENFQGKGEDVISGNIRVYDAACQETSANYSGRKLILGKPVATTNATPDGKLLLTGIEALAIGAVASGAKFIAAYPMTPSTGLITYLAETSHKTGILAEQAEDEISAINMAIGASYAGVRSLTATSGGGFCLMVEGLSLAAMTEVPIVIALGQRPGPATGLPTRTEQGELNFALSAGHGEFPRFIFAPSDAISGYNMMLKAFDLSQKYRVPSIILYDQYIADSYWTVDKEKIKTPELKNYYTDPQNIVGEFRTFQITDDGISPRLYPGQSRHTVIVDSDEHDEYGHITENLETRKIMVEKRWKKFPAMEKEMGVHLPEDIDSAEIILISWGSNAGPSDAAAKIIREKGINVQTVNYVDIWPLAVPEIFKKTSAKIAAVENNYTGQFARLLESHGVPIEKKILKYNGLPFTAEEIAQETIKWLS